MILLFAGILWSDRHWEACDSEKESTASHKKLLNTSPSLATEYSYTDPAGQKSDQLSSKRPTVTKPTFESPYATSNVIYDQDRKIKVKFKFFLTIL